MAARVERWRHPNRDTCATGAWLRSSARVARDRVRHRGRSRTRAAAAVGAAAWLAACSDSPGSPSPALRAPELGSVTARFTGEVWVVGTTAYTSTWGLRGTTRGDAVYVWDVSGARPVLVDSLVIENATTTGDVQASDDGRLLVVATERANGSIVVYSLDDPRRPARIARHQSPNTTNGVHTAAVARVDGALYAFLSVDPAGSSPSRLTIVDLTNPQAPVEVLSRPMGSPFVHDVFVRDGLLFTALWDAGVTIWDVGGGGRGGTVANPVPIGNVLTVSSVPGAGSEAHNIWWYHDGATGSKRYAFVGEEGTTGATVGASSIGDIHVVDVSDMANPREVAFFHLPGAGTHNFSVDEEQGILYAAYYNGGVRAIDVRGDLATCTAAQRSSDGRCDLRLMGREMANLLEGHANVFVWGVHFVGEHVYASDMLNGLWKLRAVRR